MVSEEHEKKPLDFSSIPEIDLHLPEVESIVAHDQNVPKDQITVWIDPLDATQEYTEMKDTGECFILNSNNKTYLYGRMLFRGLLLVFWIFLRLLVGLRFEPMLFSLA